MSQFLKIKNFGIFSFIRKNILLMIKYIKNLINIIRFEYNYYMFIFLLNFNQILFRAYIIYFIFIIFSYTILLFFTIFFYISYLSDSLEIYLWLYALEHPELLKHSYTNVFTECIDKTPSDMLILATDPDIGLPKDLEEDMRSRLSLAKLSSADKNAEIVNTSYIGGDKKYKALKFLNDLNLVQMETIVDEAVVEDKAEDIVKNIEAEDEDKSTDIVTDIDIFDRMNILDTLLYIHHNKFDISEFTNNFPLHRIELEINFKKSFEFTFDYSKLINYVNFVKIERENEIIQVPQFLSFSVLIGPQAGFPFNDIESDISFLKYNYIPTNFIASYAKTTLPVIQGQMVLADDTCAIKFITNLISLNELKLEAPILDEMKIEVRDTTGKPFELYVAEAQHIIQATARVAILKEIKIQDPIIQKALGLS
jgi:hypothetical protein